MTQAKKHIAWGLYEAGRLEVFFDPQAEGVIIPEHLKAWPQVKFDYGEGLPIPIPDLDMDDAGISATLSFNMSPFKTFLPWKAIYFMTTSTEHAGGNAVWPDDVPKHLTKQIVGAPEVEPKVAASDVMADVPARRERPEWMKVV